MAVAKIQIVCYDPFTGKLALKPSHYNYALFGDGPIRILKLHGNSKRVQTNKIEKQIKKQMRFLL